GNVHGMPLAALMGLPPHELGNIYDFSPKVQPENCVLVGIRDVDNFEKENIRKSGVQVFTMRDIDERGMRAVMEEALRMAGHGTAGYHVSLDMDWIDPEDAPGVGTPVWGGATYREAHLAMEIVADHGLGRRVGALGIWEEDTLAAAKAFKTCHPERSEGPAFLSVQETADPSLRSG